MPVTANKVHRVLIDKATLTVCNHCFNKLTLGKAKGHVASSAPGCQSKLLSTRTIKPQNTVVTRNMQYQKKQSSIDQRNLNVYERFELVDDYAERIKKAREALGWSQATLAAKAKVSENIVKRIEGGKLRPTHDLAKKLEDILNIRLLVPVIEESISGKKKSVSKEVTLGEIVNLKEE
jgi:putative transcription factor